MGKRACVAAALLLLWAGSARSELEEGFRTPPAQARMWAYWWWLNGNVTKAAICRDLTEMKAKGFGGAVLTDGNGADQQGNLQVPAGPLFGSPAWRELFRHALREADRLGLELTLTIQSGWNVGGPNVRPEEATKLVTWSATEAVGPARWDRQLPAPKAREGFYREIAVLAYPLKHPADRTRRPIDRLDAKTASKEAGFSNPDTRPLLFDRPAEPGEEDAASRQVIDLSRAMDPDGTLRWQVPEGRWEILRVGYTASGARVSTGSGGWQGLAIDYLDAHALESFWHSAVEPLLEDAKPYLGRTLRYLFSDSWEVGGANWTADFRQQFQRCRGYDLLPFLPVLAGRILDSREESNRFLNDLRKTVGDLIAENHYEWFAAAASRYGLGVHPEAGGPHGAPIDALKTLGKGSFPQMEYWARSHRHRTRDEDRFFVKQAASAAHIYGKTLVAAEGMTTIGPHWSESLWANLKPSFDRALCEGLNRLVFTLFTCSPAEMGKPGQEMMAGTHFNPNITWWELSGAFVSYVNRSQFLLQQGLFVADALYYYGDHVPNFVRLKGADPAKVMPGYDYDVTNEEVLLERLRFENGRLRLPDGMSYRVLVLPDLPMTSLPALRKVRELVAAGATVIGRKPERTTGREGFPEADREVARLAGELWDQGRVITGRTARQVLEAAGVPPDFECSGALDYIHRSSPEAEIYFLSSQQEQPQNVRALFRVSGKAPELWDAETGAIRRPAAFDFTTDGRTRLDLKLKPYGSVFVVFRQPAADRVTSSGADLEFREGNLELRTTQPGTFTAKLASGRVLKATVPPLPPVLEIRSPWHVGFSGPLAVPGPTIFDTLRSWTESPDPNVKYFAGTAAYRTEVAIPAAMLGTGWAIELDLGKVHEVAEVLVNGRNLGIWWTAPFSRDITAAVKPGVNRIEVRVTNLWPNRLIGDAGLPEAERHTRTNISGFHKDMPLLPSGLLGPVTLRPIAVQSLQ